MTSTLHHGDCLDVLRMFAPPLYRRATITLSASSEVVALMCDEDGSRPGGQSRQYEAVVPALPG
jgi:hypothetical protein